MYSERTRGKGLSKCIGTGVEVMFTSGFRLLASDGTGMQDGLMAMGTEAWTKLQHAVAQSRSEQSGRLKDGSV